VPTSIIIIMAHYFISSLSFAFIETRLKVAIICEKLTSRNNNHQFFQFLSSLRLDNPARARIFLSLFLVLVCVMFVFTRVSIRICARGCLNRPKLPNPPNYNFNFTQMKIHSFRKYVLRHGNLRPPRHYAVIQCTFQLRPFARAESDGNRVSRSRGIFN